MNETLLYVLKRLGQAILTLFLASALCFAIIQLAPGDYLDTLRLNPQISPERLEELIKQFGLDKPGLIQYERWLWRVVTHFDFGTSFLYWRPVSSLLLERIPATLLLAIASIIVTWAIAIPLGIISAVKQNSTLDKFLRVLSYFGQGFPSFITALLLLFVAQNLSPLFPIGGMTSINYNYLSPLGKVLDIGWHMILPTIALSITSFAGLQRLTRGQLLDVLRQDYIQTARAKGLPEDRVIYVHALRNAVNPLITLLGFEFASLLARRLRMGELTAENVEKVMEAFVTNINNTYVCFPVEPTDFNQAATLLMQGNTALRAGDALHLSIALNRKTDNFLTLDRKLLAAANVLGVTASSGGILT